MVAIHVSLYVQDIVFLCLPVDVNEDFIMLHISILGKIHEHLPPGSLTFHELQAVIHEPVSSNHLQQPSQENPKDHSYAAKTCSANGCVMWSRPAPSFESEIPSCYQQNLAKMYFGRFHPPLLYYQQKIQIPACLTKLP